MNTINQIKLAGKYKTTGFWNQIQEQTQEDPESTIKSHLLAAFAILAEQNKNESVNLTYNFLFELLNNYLKPIEEQKEYPIFEKWLALNKLGDNKRLVSTEALQKAFKLLREQTSEDTHATLTSIEELYLSFISLYLSD